MIRHLWEWQLLKDADTVVQHLTVLTDLLLIPVDTY